MPQIDGQERWREQTKNEAVGIAVVVLASIVSLILSKTVQFIGLLGGLDLDSLFLPILGMVLASFICIGILIEIKDTTKAQ